MQTRSSPGCGNASGEQCALTDNAEAQLEAIYDYTERRWNADQAERYTRDILQACTEIALKQIRSRPIAAELGFDGFVAKRGSHFIYWRNRRDGDIDIVAILHQRMVQEQRLADLF